MQMVPLLGLGSRWLERVCWLVAKEEVTANTVAGVGLREVGGIPVDIQNHFAGKVADGGIRALAFALVPFA